MSQDKRSRSVIGIFFIIFLLFFIFLVFSIFMMKNMKIGDVAFDADQSEGKASIAVVEVKGAIMDSKKTIELLHKAERDEAVEAIIIRVDSPGGAVGPTQEIYEEIVRIDQKIPVYASFGSVAASGGYYIGAACRKIFANAGTLTGSIGVIMQFMDLSKLYTWAKVNPETIKAGKYKDIGAPNRPMTTEERRLMDDMISVVHRQFINDISLTRKDRIVGDLLEHAQGQIFSGEDALKRGLVDEIGGLWAAGRKIHEELGLEGEFEDFMFVKGKKKLNFRTFFEDIEEEASSFIRNLTTKKVVPMFLYQ